MNFSKPWVSPLLSLLTLSSLPSPSLLHRHVSGLQVPSSHITFLSSARPLSFTYFHVMNGTVPPAGLLVLNQSRAVLIGLSQEEMWVANVYFYCSGKAQVEQN